MAKGWDIKVQNHNVTVPDVIRVTIFVHPNVSLQDLAKKVEAAMGYSGPSECTRISLFPIGRTIQAKARPEDKDDSSGTIASSVLQTPVQIIWNYPTGP